MYQTLYLKQNENNVTIHHPLKIFYKKYVLRIEVCVFIYNVYYYCIFVDLVVDELMF